MTIYIGRFIKKDQVSLGEPDLDLIRTLDQDLASDLDWNKWRERALCDEKVVFFAIYNREDLVGEIFLHDIDLDKHEALVGYHLFETKNRGKGIGTRAMQLLQQYVIQETHLKRLIVITGENNLPSIGMVEKCEFHLIGTSHEDPNRVVYEWRVGRYE